MQIEGRTDGAAVKALDQEQIRRRAVMGLSGPAWDGRMFGEAGTVSLDKKHAAGINALPAPY
jgi:hypothetical protein